MKRAAVFVEGQTEAIFIKRLLEEMAGEHAIVFSRERKHAGLYIIEAVSVARGQKYEVLIVDCCTDNQVLSSIIERYPSLEGAGYELIVGVRDLYPQPAASLPVVQAAIAPHLPVGAAVVFMAIAVQEVEAWFLQEETHFAKVDPALTSASIKSATGYDIHNDLSEEVAHPAGLLNDIYRIAGKAYRKTKKHVERTVDALDYHHLYLARRPVLDSLDALLLQLDNFLAAPKTISPGPSPS
ncbi:hypothetical protein P7B04_23470 [Sphingobium yanoikuyae]|uniref:hypothetical protein n=1 Tax=Sphingobium yanoikuyae TaxID=13690 RepID=UPI0024105F4E|nr:hypothetical protein [Sphingobium yanoikuyae]MDG2515633.1 hypothetical protein [Sphingobium yanoikuyae]